MNVDVITWHTAISFPYLSQKDVHIWRAFLNVNEHESYSLFALLSPDEAERARRFHFERDQKRFIAARGILRQILGRYLDLHPAEICFEYTSYGKPFLTETAGKAGLNFNLSHSGAYALYAFTRGRHIGIDIEQIRNDVAAEQIAERFFSKNELHTLEAVHLNQRSELFFQYWARKEAFIKAIGEGVSFPIEQCDVSQANGSGFSPIILLNNSKEISRWYIQDIFPGDGYAGAISLEEKKIYLTCWDYTG